MNMGLRGWTRSVGFTLAILGWIGYIFLSADRAIGRNGIISIVALLATFSFFGRRPSETSLKNGLHFIFALAAGYMTMYGVVGATGNQLMAGSPLLWRVSMMAMLGGGFLIMLLPSIIRFVLGRGFALLFVVLATIAITMFTLIDHLNSHLWPWQSTLLVFVAFSLRVLNVLIVSALVLTTSTNRRGLRLAILAIAVIVGLVGWFLYLSPLYGISPRVQVTFGP